MSKNLFAEYFGEILKITPGLASYLGDRRKDDHYENALSQEYIEASLALTKNYLRKLRAQKRKRNGVRSIQDETFAWVLKTNLAGSKFPTETLPTTSFENLVLDLAFIDKELYPTPSESRHRDYVAIIDTATERMREGMAKNMRLPRIICQTMLKTMKQAYRKKAYAPGTREATARMIAFVEKEYLPACRETLGTCFLPDGKAFYKHLVKENTTLDITPEEVYAYGIDEVARIEAAFYALQDELKCARCSLRTFYKKVMSDPRQYFGDAKDVLGAYRRLREEIQRDVWKKHFAYTLRRNYDVKPVPVSMEATAPGAFYMPSSYATDAKSFKGTFYVNTRDRKENPKYAMYALSLHEGFHHYQYQYMIENKIPAYMIYGIDGTAYVEGIALYAEGLGDYEHKPYETFGKLVYEMLRAVRLVVDTGVHWYGWSWKKALAYMRTHLPMAKGEIETELERYICAPGQALSYSIGRRTFVELRDTFLAAKVGTLKDYHTLILEDGVLPLEVLRRKVERAIRP